ncbi:MAG TPA: type VI secretion system baseplate subunit TssG [Pyrinomonadaceae bacterium]|nr:type VI secretion system baseplate subunit TssG [Pyrinomonadaceae bacterium]
MAAESRTTDRSLARELLDEPYRFGFFQAVRLLERIDPERHAVGHDAAAEREAVRFRTRQTLSFPASEIYEIATDGEDGSIPPEMFVAFMGLTGPLGVLPHNYSELVIDRIRHNDTTLWNFFDIFNHRMLSLFYRVWEKYRFPIAYERGKLDDFTQSLFSLVGIGTEKLRNRLSLNDQILIFYGGLVAQRPHSASAITAILGDYFRVPVEAQQYSGQWLKLGDDVTRLGESNSFLGISTIAGARVWDAQSMFRLRFGPLSLDEFRAFLPNGSAFQSATELTRLLVGLELDFDMQLVLDAGMVPFCVLETGSDAQPRLGWTSWLKSRPVTRDDDQVVLPVKADGLDLH